MKSGDVDPIIEVQKFWKGLANYYDQESRSLKARFEQLESLIGSTHHHQMDGYHCEEIVRSLLMRVLPSSLTVSTGFVRGNPHMNIESKLKVASPQIDILIHKTSTFAPIYEQGIVSVVLPDAVSAIIEVKKRLKTDLLADAVRNIAMTLQLLIAHRRNGIENMFSGVFAFSNEVSLETDSVKDILLTEAKKYGTYAFLPQLIVILNEAIIAIEGDAHSITVTCVSAEIEMDGRKVDISYQYFLNVLMRITEPEALRGTKVTPFAFPSQGPSLINQFSLDYKDLQKAGSG